MAPKTRNDQPSGVETEEIIKPSDSDVTTSDTEGSPSDTDDGNPGTGDDDPPAAAATDKGADPNKSTPASDDDTKDDDTSPSKVKRRIKRLSRKLARSEQSRESDAATIAEQNQRITELESQVKAAPKPPEPELKDFESPQAYAKAYAKWEADTATPTKSAAHAKTTPEKPKPAQHTPDPKIAEFEQAGIQLLGDEFGDAFKEPGTSCTEAMADYLFDSDVGPAIYVHLTNNQEDSHRIASLPIPEQLKELKKLDTMAKANELDIDGQLQFEPEKKPAAKKAVETAAAPGKKPSYTPPDHRDGGESTLTPDPEEMSMDDYKRHRDKQELEKRGIYQ